MSERPTDAAAPAGDDCDLAMEIFHAATLRDPRAPPRDARPGVRYMPLPKSQVRHFSGVRRTSTVSAVLGLLSAYHLPSSGPR